VVRAENRPEAACGPQEHPEVLKKYATRGVKIINQNINEIFRNGHKPDQVQ
jgi:hypothetical protein